MKTYLARLNAGDTARAREIVGIFSAETEEQLFWLVDECCSPLDVEVCELGVGGIYWAGQVDLKVPVECDHEGEPWSDSDLPKEATWCADWADTFFGHGPDKWRPINHR